MKRKSQMTQAMVTLLLVSAVVSAEPVGTAFSYQGQLRDGGVPANGEYDMWFSLFDAASGGTRVAGPLYFDGGGGNEEAVFVVNGLFRVALDFGDTFDGTARWLQIEVRPHAIGSVTPLTPRQPLTAAPYAMYALDGPGFGLWSKSGADLHNVPDGNVGIGTAAPGDKLHVTGGILANGSLRSASPTSDSEVFLGWTTDAGGNDMARIRVAGNGVGASNGLDIQKTGDRSLMRIYNSGDAWLRGGIDVSGDAVVRGTLDIGLETVIGRNSGASAYVPAEAICPPGKRVITGGCYCTCSAMDVWVGCFPTGQLFASSPRIDLTGWTCGCFTAAGVETVAYAICGRIR